MKKLHLSFLAMLIYASSVAAQPISNAYVYGESGTKSNESCGISYESSIAAVKAALRYNRVSISNSAKDFYVYININNFDVDSKNCTVAVDLQVYFHSSSPVPYTGKSLLLKNILCETGTAGYLYKKDMQSTVNTAVKDLVDGCLSKIESSLSK